MSYTYDDDDEKIVNAQTGFEDFDGDDSPLTEAMKRQEITRQSELGDIYDPVKEFCGCGDDGE